MAPHSLLRIHRKVIFLCLVFSLLALFTSFASSEQGHGQGRRPNNRFRRLLLEDDLGEEDLESQSIKKKSKSTSTSSSLLSGTSGGISTSGSKNKTKPIKPSSSSSSSDSAKSKTESSAKSSKATSSTESKAKDEAKLIKPTSSSSKNKTTSNSSSTSKSGGELSYTGKVEKNGPTQLEKSKLNNNNKKSQQLDSTSTKKAESSDSSSIKKSSDPSNTSQKFKTSSKSSSTDKEGSNDVDEQSSPSNLKSNSKPKKKSKEGSDDVDEQSSPTKTTTSSDQTKKKTTTTSTSTPTKKQPSPTTATITKKSTPTTEDTDIEDDLVTEFTDLPTKFHQTFIPDFQRISTSSKIYLAKSHTQFTKGYIKPYVGHRYAPAVATAISCIFIIIPLLLVSLLFNRIKAYFSLQKLLIFVQVYLSIYFTILCLSSLVTGLEPLRFFYATSPATYVWLQALQTLGYVVYLFLLLMYLVLVFSTESGVALKALGLAQTFVGFAVGLHYYVAVVHRMVHRQPPRTNWKVHGIYAACFLLICIGTRAERRKKAYLVEDGEEGKTS